MNKAFSKKRKINAIYRTAKQNDLPFELTWQLLKQISKDKALRRKIKRYGTYINWHEVEYLGAMLNVPVRSQKDGEVMAYQCFLCKEMLPHDKHHLWPTDKNDG
ncbi:hypothetical protein [Colwellia sp. MEBiC06753]